MKFKKFLTYSLCAGMLLAANACGDDEPSTTDETEQGGNGGGDDNGGTSGAPMTVEESKQYIGNVAEEAANLFNPEDQRPLVELFDFFLANFGDFDFDIEGPDYSPARYIRNLRKAASGDLLALTRAAETYQYDIRFNDYTGIYEPRGHSWVKTADSSDIQFRFQDQRGQNCIIKAEASSDYTNVNFSIDDYDYYWNGTTYVEESWTNEYRLQVPRTVKVTLTQANSTLASATVKSNLDLNGKTFNVDVDSQLANLKATAVANGTDNTVTANAHAYVGSTELINAQAVLNGSRLCDYDYISQITDNGNTAAIRALFSNANATGTIMDKIRVNLEGSANNSFWSAMENDYWDWYDGISLEQARREAQSTIENLRRAITGKICYNGLNTERATLDYVTDEWGTDSDYWYIEILPVMKFADGTTYEFEEYFENGFDGVSDVFGNLIDSYSRLWN